MGKTKRKSKTTKNIPNNKRMPDAIIKAYCDINPLLNTPVEANKHKNKLYGLFLKRTRQQFQSEGKTDFDDTENVPIADIMRDVNKWNTLTKEAFFPSETVTKIITRWRENRVFYELSDNVIDTLNTNGFANIPALQLMNMPHELVYVNYPVTDYTNGFFAFIERTDDACRISFLLPIKLNNASDQVPNFKTYEINLLLDYVDKETDSHDAHSKSVRSICDVINDRRSCDVALNNMFAALLFIICKEGIDDTSIEQYNTNFTAYTVGANMHRYIQETAREVKENNNNPNRHTTADFMPSQFAMIDNTLHWARPTPRGIATRCEGTADAIALGLEKQQSKCCKKCNIRKTMDNFDKNATSKDGHSYTCRECASKQPTKMVTDKPKAVTTSNPIKRTAQLIDPVDGTVCKEIRNTADWRAAAKFMDCTVDALKTRSKQIVASCVKKPYIVRTTDESIKENNLPALNKTECRHLILALDKQGNIIAKFVRISDATKYAHIKHGSLSNNPDPRNLITCYPNGKKNPAEQLYFVQPKYVGQYSYTDPTANLIATNIIEDAQSNTLTPTVEEQEVSMSTDAKWKPNKSIDLETLLMIRDRDDGQCAPDLITCWVNTHHPNKGSKIKDNDVLAIREGRYDFLLTMADQTPQAENELDGINMLIKYLHVIHQENSLIVEYLNDTKLSKQFDEVKANWDTIG